MKYFTFYLLFLFSIFFSPPSSAVSTYIKLRATAENFCFSDGDVVTWGAISSCSYPAHGVTYGSCYKDGANIMCRDPNKNYMRGAMWVGVSGCPVGYELSSSGVCVEIPVCGDGQILDGSMENCIDDPNDDWCSDQVAQEYNSCYESNGIFDYSQWQCDESTHTVSSSKCDLSNSDKCYFGQPSYPACLGDSSDIKGPDSNYDPETPNTSNPDAGYDKSEPDAVTPDDSTDGAVLAAVQNMNRDMNDANTQINKDMNVGFGKIKDAVGQTNKNLDAIGKVLENSVGQDTQARREAADFYQGNLAGLQGIQAGVNNLGKKIDSGFDSLAEIYKGNISAPTSCTNFSCEGNAASCYLAQEQWRQYCAAGAELNNLSPAMAEVTNYLQETAEGYVDENGAMKGLYYDNPSTMEDYLSAYTQENGFNFASGCPQPRVYTVSIASSSVKFALDFTPFCTLALVFRALLMATASIGSLLMFAKFM